MATTTASETAKAVKAIVSMKVMADGSTALTLAKPAMAKLEAAMEVCAALKNVPALSYAVSTCEAIDRLISQCNGKTVQADEIDSETP